MIAQAPREARPPARPDPLLAFTAEALLGAQLVVRHRAPRVALGLASCAALLVAAADAWMPPDPARPARHMALAVALAGGVAAVAGARLFAPGPALHSARYVAVSVGRAVAARVLGACGMVAVPAVGFVLVLAPRDASAATMVSVFAATTAATALSAGMVPLLGILPGGAGACLTACSVVLWPMPVVTTAWSVGCGAVAVLGGWLARTMVGRGRAPARL